MSNLCAVEACENEGSIVFQQKSLCLVCAVRLLEGQHKRIENLLKRKAGSKKTKGWKCDERRSRPLYSQRNTKSSSGRTPMT